MKSRILALTLIVALTSAIVCAGDNSAGGVSTEANYAFVISPHGYAEGYSELDGTLGLGYYDIVWFMVLGAGDLNLEVEDCCFMGDTMVATGSLMIGGPASFMDWATSPDIISMDVSCPDFALGYMLVGYIDAPSGFPAGYYWRADMGSVFGTWELRFDWYCDDKYIGVSMTNIYDDGTWDNDQGYSGTWTLVGDQFTQYYDDVMTMTIYEGTVTPDGTYMEGTMESVHGEIGCWWADKVAVPSTEASQGDSGRDAAGN
ncbi:MAG: hypothetical protein ACYS6K_05250 [Planctomycetota bacterium]|jgi:hypothetical protein